MVEISGRSYKVTRGSDVDRDGMYLEVEDEQRMIIAEVFYHDSDDSMTFTSFRPSLPLPLVEWLIAQAKVLLVPVEGKNR